STLALASTPRSKVTVQESTRQLVETPSEPHPASSTAPMASAAPFAASRTVRIGGLIRRLVTRPGYEPAPSPGTTRGVIPHPVAAPARNATRRRGRGGTIRGVGVLVEDNPARRRFEILVDDALAGCTTYEQRPGAVVLVRTEVDPSFAGRGVGTAL